MSERKADGGPDDELRLPKGYQWKRDQRGNFIQVSQVMLNLDPDISGYSDGPERDTALVWKGETIYGVLCKGSAILVERIPAPEVAS